MTQYGAEEEKREFLLSHNEKLNTQTERTYFNQNTDDDLIFMQIDADCDVIGPSYCKILNYIIYKFLNIS